MAKKPNLLILTPDQYRADYISCYGHKTIQTSNIDRLASEGVRFDRCYCSAPLCGPSRISFATSLRFSEHGRRNYWSCIDYGVPNLIKSLKEEGFRTGMFGKNHLFLYDQLENIWDELHEICLGNYDQHPDYKRAYSSFVLDDEHEYNITAKLTDEAIDFINRCSSETPFLCWVNWQDPHPAYTCPQPYASMFKPDKIQLPPNWTRETTDKPQKLENWRINSFANECSEEQARKAIAMYMGQCRYIDDQVGRLYSYLEESSQIDNTIILFFSDHGELIGDFGVFHKLPLFYECLTRIPVIIRYPNKKVKPFCFDGLVEEVDIVPTILEAMGCYIPQSMVGISWHSNIYNKINIGRENVLVEAGLQTPTSSNTLKDVLQKAPFAPNSFGPGAMVSDGRYKLSIYHDDHSELYDLKEDQYEINNLYDKKNYEKIQARLTETLVKRLLGVGVRPNGPWKEDCIDMRNNPPESRSPSWLSSELIIKDGVKTILKKDSIV